MGIFHSDGENGSEGASPEPGGAARVVPLLPLRDIVIFPHMVVPLFVGRSRSIQALEDAMSNDRDLLL